MKLPEPETPKDLASWTPRSGVLSIYLAIDPGDRGGKWRIELKDCADELLRERATPRKGDPLRATLDRVLERFDENGAAEGRCHAGFLELAPKRGEERWYAAQLEPRRTDVMVGPRPYLRPMVELLDEGAPTGVVAVSADRVRLWEWELGVVSYVEDLELTTTGDWRERKAQRPPNPSSVVGVSASGHDQYDERLEAHRERFLRDAGGRATRLATSKEWRELLVFAEGKSAQRFEAGLDDHVARRVVHADVVAEGKGEIAERMRTLSPQLNRERELRIVGEVTDAALASNGRGSLGPAETMQALVEGRVSHLVFDAGRDFSGQGIEEALAYEPVDEGLDGLPVAEVLVERAIATGAAVTPVEGEAASRLDEHDGVGALLRY